MALKIRHANKNVKNTPWRHKVWHYVKKCVKTSKSVSCCQKVPWCQNVCHVINKSWCPKLCHVVKTFVMTSKSQKVRHDIKNTSWRQRCCHDVKNMSWRQKVSHNVKNTSWCQTKIILTSNIFFNQFYISTMCRPRVINDYEFSTNLVTLILDQIQWYLLTISVLYAYMSMYSFVAIRIHLTTLWCDIMLRAFRLRRLVAVASKILLRLVVTTENRWLYLLIVRCSS